ncbi:MAG: putative immunity protein [Erysipelotrichaceae bacterium]
MIDCKASIQAKFNRGNHILFSRESECLQELIALIGMQKHRTLVMWALDCAVEPLEYFESKYPNETRLRRALELSEAWARGVIKMPEAKRAILDAHSVAKEIDDIECIALAHAVGHAGATVHTETHALGLVFYELTAIVRRAGIDQCESPVENRIKTYFDRLLYWQANIDHLDVEWAAFLLDDNRPNKEQILSEKRKSSI